MIGIRLVRGQIERGEDRTEKQPGAELSRHQIGMLTLPAETGSGGQGFFHHWRGVDKDLHVTAGATDQPAPDLLEP